MSLDIVDACLLGARAAVRSGLFRPQPTNYSRARRRSIFVRAISGFGAVTAASLVLGLASCTSYQVGSASASVALSPLPRQRLVHRLCPPHRRPFPPASVLRARC